MKHQIGLKLQLVLFLWIMLHFVASTQIWAQAGTTEIASAAERYAASIREIDEKGKIYMSVYHVSNLLEFKQLAADSRHYTVECIQFLAAADKSKRQRTIAIMATSGLAIEDRLIFLRQIIKLFDEGKILPYELDNAVFPYFDLSNQIVLQYRNAGVVDILREIGSKSGVDNRFKENMARVLSGQAVFDLLWYWASMALHGLWVPSISDLWTAIWLLVSGYLLPLEIEILAIGAFGVPAAIFFYCRLRTWRNELVQQSK